MQTDYPETYSLSMSASSFDDAFTPSMVHDSGFVPSRAATPEPCSPRSRSLQLRQDSDLATRPAFNPYSVYESTSTRRRSQASKASPPKRSLVSFLFFRRAFPQLYPVIDRLEKQQGAKSAIIGSIWRRLPDEQREPFFRMQQRSAEEFRIAQGLPLDAPRADPIKTLMRRDRARQRRAADDKLSPRSELIVSLWEQSLPDDDIIRAVEAFDAKHGTNMKGKSETKQTKGKPSAPLANQTNTTAAEVEALPSTPVLHVAVQMPDYAPTPSLSDSFSSPATSPTATSPVIRTPSPDTSNPVYFALPPCLPAGLDVPFVLPANHMSSQPCGDFQPYMPVSENWNRMIAPVSAPLVAPYQPWSHIDPKLTVNANLLSAPCEHAPTLYDSVAVPSCSPEYFQSFGIQPAAPFEHPFEHALGSQEELAGLAAYDAANVAPNFGDLFESFVEVSCMPY